MTEKVILERAIFRPSNLDKLNECGWWKNSETRNQTTLLRGNDIDSLLRRHYQGETVSVPPDYLEGYNYAVQATDRIAGNYQIETRKEFCKIEIPRFAQPGECDAAIPAALISIDWKSGHLRSYKLQQAAYALGQMLTNWAPRWNAVVIFFDEGQCVWERFELAEAQELIDQVRDGYDFPGEPKVNPYCSWCGNFDICPAQRELAGYALAVPERAIDFQDILADPAKLGKFLQGCHTLAEYEKAARVRAREYFFQKVPVPGFSLANGKRSYSLPVETLALLLSSRKDWPGATRVALDVYGPMAKPKYHELCEKLKIEPDDKLLKVSQGEPYIRAKEKER